MIGCQNINPKRNVNLHATYSSFFYISSTMKALIALVIFSSLLAIVSADSCSCYCCTTPDCRYREFVRTVNVASCNFCNIDICNQYVRDCRYSTMAVCGGPLAGLSSIFAKFVLKLTISL